jgi:hypothetical protein
MPHHTAKALDPIGVSFRGYCCWDRLVAQLLYRYEREHAAGHRSTLQRLFECDVSSEVHMVLTVAEVHAGNGAVAAAASRVTSPIGPWIELTDGWYCVGGLPADAYMAKLIAEGKVVRGMKLRVWGCALVVLRPSNGGSSCAAATAESAHTLLSNYAPATAAPPLDCALNSDDEVSNVMST